MKKYRVNIEVSYEVEAENEDDAEIEVKSMIIDDLPMLECFIEEINSWAEIKE